MGDGHVSRIALLARLVRGQFAGCYCARRTCATEALVVRAQPKRLCDCAGNGLSPASNRSASCDFFPDAACSKSLLSQKLLQIGIHWKRPAGAATAYARLVRGWGEIRPIRAPSVACATCWNDTLHANCLTKNISSARQFQRRASPIGDGRTHLSIRGGAAAIGTFLRSRAA